MFQSFLKTTFRDILSIPGFTLLPVMSREAVYQYLNLAVHTDTETVCELTSGRTQNLISFLSGGKQLYNNMSALLNLFVGSDTQQASASPPLHQVSFLNKKGQMTSIAHKNFFNHIVYAEIRF